MWTDAASVRQFRLLPGPFNSPESLAAFATLQLELMAAPHHPALTAARVVSVNELLLAYAAHAERHYRLPDGSPTSEVWEVRIVSRAVRALYGERPVTELGPLAIKAARQRWIDEERSRTECNRRVGLIKRILKWGVSEELVPPAVFEAARTVAGLQRGRSAAREKDPVGPVDDAVVDATVPFLNRHVCGLVQFQRLTGCRPGEARNLRWCDIDTTGAVWVYRPAHHKNSWRGTRRDVAIGPRAQALLLVYPTPHPTDYLFSPRRAVAEQLAERAARRATPRWPSHLRRNAQKRAAAPGRPPAEKYSRGSYEQAVDRACDRAFPPPPPLAQRGDESAAAWRARLTAEQRDALLAWQKSHRWSPNQLRHTFATAVRKRFGTEAARVTLGHSSLDVTQVYAERDDTLAERVVAELG